MQTCRWSLVVSLASVSRARKLGEVNHALAEHKALVVWVGHENASAQSAISYNHFRRTERLNHCDLMTHDIIASCGIRAHDLPLTERVLYQLS